VKRICLPELRYATAQVTRTSREGGGGNGGAPRVSQGANEPWAASAPASASSASAAGGDVWNTPGSYNDETPF
jgi:single-strand DNA-binding protein